MVVRVFAQILAHQGGWDEFLWIAGPLMIVGGLLWVANRRANALSDSALNDSTLNDSTRNSAENDE